MRVGNAHDKAREEMTTDSGKGTTQGRGRTYLEMRGGRHPSSVSQADAKKQRTWRQESALRPEEPGRCSGNVCSAGRGRRSGGAGARREVAHQVAGPGPGPHPPP